MYLLDVMWGQDMFVRHVNKDGTADTNKFGYIFKTRLSGGFSNSAFLLGNPMTNLETPLQTWKCHY